MAELTRRRMKDSKADAWHVCYGDVQVGTIGMRSGVPNGVDQWGCTCGFISQRLTPGNTPCMAPVCDCRRRDVRMKRIAP